MMKGVNLRFSATNAASPVMKTVQRDLGRMQKTVRAGQPAMKSWNAGLNANRRAVQQFGFQMSDFAMQVAGGQSALLAFTQQGSQILQFFGPAGSVLGALIAVFGSLALAFIRSGKSLMDLFPLMGVLQDDFRALGNVIRSTKEVMLDFTNLVVNNLDVLLISAALLTGFFAVKWVAGFLAARTATGLLIGTLTLLKAAIIRTGIGALIIFVGYLIERFLALSGVVGGVGKTFGLFFRVGRDIFKRLSEQPMTIAYAMQAAAAKMASFFIARLGSMLSSFMEFTWDVAEGFNTLFNTNLEGAKIGLQLQAMNRLVISLDDTAAGAAARMREVFGGPIESLEELRAAIAAINDNDIDVRDWFTSSADGADSLAGAASNAANAVNKKLTPAMERLKAVQDTVSSAFESGMMAMVERTKSVKDAFRSMASDIIKELYRIFVVKRITGMISGAIGNMLPGGIPMTPAPSFEGGGFTWNGPRAGGVDGRGGRMAVLHPNETVTDHVKGGGGGGVNVTVNNTFASGVSRAEFEAAMPRMIEATKAAVADAARRGGSYGKAFG